MKKILLISTLFCSCKTYRYSQFELNSNCIKITTNIRYPSSGVSIVDTTIIRYMCDTGSIEYKNLKNLSK